MIRSVAEERSRDKKAEIFFLLQDHRGEDKKLRAPYGRINGGGDRDTIYTADLRTYISTIKKNCCNIFRLYFLSGQKLKKSDKHNNHWSSLTIIALCIFARRSSL
jgi:hypothetical protein